MKPFREFEPAYSGVGLTYCRTPLVLDPAGLKGIDVAVVGAPFDLGASYRPGARFGPRAIRAAEDVGGPPARPSMDLGVDPFAVLRVVDHGDSDVSPALDACHAALQRTVTGVLEAGAVPVILGGDHSLSLPVMRALAERFGPDGYSVIHFDTHADTEIYDPLHTTPHATPFYRAVHEGALRGGNLMQIGLRGTWPPPREFAWMREQGITWRTMDDVDEQGLGTIVSQAIELAGEAAPRTYLTVDIDVLDPAFAPGTGTPEPGGLTTRELLRAVRHIGMSLDLCAVDMVEVSPPYDPTGITALAAHRVVLESLTGTALRRTGRSPHPERSRR